jgi:hypothetical protein
MKYDDDLMWAMAHSKGTPRPFICGTLSSTTRTELIRKIERDVCGEGNWRKWSRKYGAKIIRVRVTQASDD